MGKTTFSAAVLFTVIAGFHPYPSPAAAEELLGPVGREAILAHDPSWAAAAAAYQPDPAALDELRGLTREVRIEVYFGSWCSDSAVHVPALFKVLEMADTPLLQASCFGVPEVKEKRAPYFQGREIARLPTFLVLVDGREVGRIVETPEKSVEADLVRFLGL